ncbi:MAG: hypothetical protein KGD64_09105 [Candidatus Heimdallarchaeota archaeon]|nr:hypothetical protein [Candidatus Heimdallarchaeota archaeon]
MRAIVTAIYDRQTNSLFSRGLSIHIKIGNQRILMDFGMIGYVLIKNMKNLGFEPNKITKAILSHIRKGKRKGIF